MCKWSKWSVVHMVQRTQGATRNCQKKKLIFTMKFMTSIYSKDCLTLVDLLQMELVSTAMETSRERQKQQQQQQKKLL